MFSFIRTIQILLLFFFVNNALLGQQLHRCGTDEYMQMMVRKHPSWKWPDGDVEGKTNTAKTSGIVVIPVVVHVLHDGSVIGQGTHIPPAQVESQIEILNNDFRATNDDITNVPTAFQSLIGDVKIQFCLATLDPDSNPTSGIIYKQTFVPYFTLDNKMKFDTSGGDNAWPADKYLNIWVCDLRFPNGNNLLGYAQFPGGPAETDGVVVRFEAFGNKGIVSIPYNKGRTATHEVGHWLNLMHIWGDNTCGNDFVSDTPVQEQPNYGTVNNGAYLCPAYPHISCNNSPAGDMFMNYMDYTFDKCMHMFSKGQAKRMNNCILSDRPSFLNTTTLCTPPLIQPDTNTVDFAFLQNNTASNHIDVLVLGNLSTDVEVQVINGLGQLVSNHTFPKQSIESTITVTFPGVVTGFYHLQIYANKETQHLRFFKW